MFQWDFCETNDSGSAHMYLLDGQESASDHMSKLDMDAMTDAHELEFAVSSEYTIEADIQKLSFL